MICKDLKEIIPPGGIGEGGGDQGSGISCPALPTGSIVRRGNGILCMKLREEIVVSQVLSQVPKCEAPGAPANGRTCAARRPGRLEPVPLKLSEYAPISRTEFMPAPVADSNLSPRKRPPCQYFAIFAFLANSPTPLARSVCCARCSEQPR